MPAAAPSDPPPTIRHEMIRASAGSGKTYQLTNRFIQLLALGEPPDSIVALTFTRKAAGEFFSEILKKVAEACLDKMKGEQIARDIGMEGKLKPGDYRRMLRTLCRGIDRLTLGTLDSFFAGIVRHFPFELGLAANFEIVDDRLEAAEKRRVYRHVFRREARRDSPRLHDDFLAAFQLATIGGSERSLMARLDSFVGGYHSIYLAAPSPELWGNPRRIWPGGGRWFGGQADLKALGRELLDRFAERELPEKQIDRWRVFLEAAAERVPGSPVQVRTSGYSRPQPIWYLLEKLLAAIDGIESGSAELTVERRRQQLGPGECAAAFAIVRKVMRDELEVWASRTRGIWNVLNLYERYYHKLVRDQGKLRFDDLPLLLTGTGEPGRETGAPPLSGRDGDPIAGDPALPAKLNIEYRLDAKFRHWLLDEFQDTSRGQWRALEDLIDEAAQDDSGQRSVFFVGDVKQSIFAWRGGEPRLFDEIRARYNGGGEARIHERPLAESYRSGPEVIRAVNRVFGDAARGELAAMFPQAAVDRWRWDEHVSKKPEHAAYCAYCSRCPTNIATSPSRKTATRSPPSWSASSTRPRTATPARSSCSATPRRRRSWTRSAAAPACPPPASPTSPSPATTRRPPPSSPCSNAPPTPATRWRGTMS
ncbi:MAG: UvrD-helicase domain-containing protein [Verrucomicrobiales bacterium]